MIILIAGCGLLPTSDELPDGGDNIEDGGDDGGNGGGGTDPAPEIAISIDGANSTNGAIIDLGDQEVGGTLTRDIVITNSGDANLVLTGTTPITLSGADMSLFSVTQPLFTTIVPDATITFSITYAPVDSTGLNSATITITNDDTAFTLNFTATAVITPSKIVMADLGSINNGDATDITVSITNEFDVVATGETATITLSGADDLTITPSSIDITTGGTATASVTVTRAAHYYEDSITLTADNESYTQDSSTLTLVPFFAGTELTADDFNSAVNIATGNYYIAPTTVGTININVTEDILVNGGTLTIYPGNTLNFSSGAGITVRGNLEIYGLDDQRVKLTSAGSWDGIFSASTSGTSSVMIDGAYIENTSGYSIRVGDLSDEGGDLTLTNSRVVYDGTTGDVLYLQNLKVGSTYNIRNNIIISDDDEAIKTYNSDGDIDVNIEYNTILKMGSGSTAAISVYEDDPNSSYTIAHNIIYGSYNDAIGINNAQVNVIVNYNVINVSSRYIYKASTDNVIDEYNLFIDNDYYPPDSTLTLEWNDALIFTQFGFDDYSLLQVNDYPILSEANNWPSMVGSLTSGHVNEKGAYANGGYPPYVDE